MQTITFLEVSSWIASQYSSTVRDFILGGTRFWDFAHRPAPNEPNLIQAFQVTHELAAVRQKLIANPLALEVLEAFDLSELVDESFAIRLANALSSAPQATKPSALLEPITDEVGKVMRQWRVFIGCTDPLRKLLVPKEVFKEQPFDEVLTIELRYSTDTSPQAKTVSDLLSNVIKLYEAVCRASGYQDYPPLLVTYVDSGSTIRFDLRGLGAPIKEIKGFFVDVWNLVRHRKAEDFHRKGKSIIEGLEILERIDKTQRTSAITNEEANRLRLQINRAMLGLFDAGALTREVPDFEVVPNTDLMHGIQQKLLTSGSSQDHQLHSPQGDSSRQSRKGKRRSRKKRPPSETESTPEKE